MDMRISNVKASYVNDRYTEQDIFSEDDEDNEIASERNDLVPAANAANYWIQEEEDEEEENPSNLENVVDEANKN